MARGGADPVRSHPDPELELAFAPVPAEDTGGRCAHPAPRRRRHANRPLGAANNRPGGGARARGARPSPPYPHTAVGCRADLSAPSCPGGPLSRASLWLQEAVTDPRDIELEAIAVWARLLERLALPHRVPELSRLSLAEAVLLSRTSERMRFAMSWTWSASALLALHRSAPLRAERHLAELDRGAAAAVPVAAATVCCSGDSGCDTAARFAERLAKLTPRQQTCLLGDPDSGYYDLCRLLLLETNVPRMSLSRFASIASQWLVRDQIEFAAHATCAEAFVGEPSPTARLEVGKLVARTFVGSNAAPSAFDLDPETITGALVSASAEAIAAFIPPCPTDGRANDDDVERGVVAMARFLSRACLTPGQLVRWADHAADNRPPVSRDEPATPSSPAPATRDDPRARGESGQVAVHRHKCICSPYLWHHCSPSRVNWCRRRIRAAGTAWRCTASRMPLVEKAAHPDESGAAGSPTKLRFEERMEVAAANWCKVYLPALPVRLADWTPQRIVELTAGQ